MTSEIEAIVHKQLLAHSVEVSEHGYEMRSEIGKSHLKFIAANAGKSPYKVISIAEVTTRFNPGIFPPLSLNRVGQLNSMAVHGAYVSSDGRLEMTAQYSVYQNEPAETFVARTILDTFAGQMALGYSILAGSFSGEVQRRQRTFQECPRKWKVEPGSHVFPEAAEYFRSQGIMSSASDDGFTAEVILSGESASRMTDANADTALVRVGTKTLHPIGGVGYLATIALPKDPSRETAAVICHRLNAIEAQQLDFVPRLGAWGLRGIGDELVYSQFWPASERIGQLHQTMMSWMVLRSHWLGANFWHPEVGVVLPATDEMQP